MQGEVPFKQYIMFDHQPTHQDIHYWENVISYPEDLVKFINKIDEEPESYSRISKWADWTASNDKSLVYGRTKNVNTEALKEKTGSELVDRKTLYIANSLLMAFEMCTERYFKGLGINGNDYQLDLNTIPIKEWYEGQSMGPHFDGQDGNTNLAFSLVAYLNDDYEGGEIHFPNQNITIKPKAGSLIIFPSQEPFIHEVKTITSGTRYMSPAHIYKK
jgi:hypothetical protein